MNMAKIARDGGLTRMPRALMRPMPVVVCQDVARPGRDERERTDELSLRAGRRHMCGQAGGWAWRPRGDQIWECHQMTVSAGGG